MPSKLLSRNIKNFQYVSLNFLSKSTSPPPNSSLNVFDRETKRLQRIRTANDPNYKDYEYIKSEVGYRVADRVFDIKRTFNAVLDLGCQRGYVSKHLTKDVVNKIYMFEMADKLLVRRLFVFFSFT